MKTQTTQQNNSNAEKTPGRNQASVRTIIQAYRSRNTTAPIAQLLSNSGTYTVKDKIESADLSDWNVVRKKLGIRKGKDADSSIGAKANSSLTALKIIKGQAMSAHMIPNRLGGVGNSSNVRPWDKSFEDGTWKTNVEDIFDSELVGKKKDDTISYFVDTEEMDDTYYNGLKTKSIADNSVKNDATHKINIQQIPTSVKATIGSKSLAKTTAPIDGLII